MATESVDEIIWAAKERDISVDEAKQRLDAYYTRECARKVLEGNVKYVTGWLSWVKGGGGHITRTQLEESLAELRAAIQEVGGGDKPRDNGILDHGAGQEAWENP